MEYLNTFKQVLLDEAKSLERLAGLVSQEDVNKLINSYQTMASNSGSLIFCGVGKSGLVAAKVAATFSSLGLNSFFLHPTEALHGDLGRVSKNDIICFLSKSGTTEEILKLIPYLPFKKEQVIGLLGNTKSPIASECHLVLDCSVEKEACVNNQAPTTSSTAAMAVGDAMAVVYEKFVGLSKEGFAENHPGGILGKSLRMKVNAIMWKVNDCPVFDSNTNLKDILLAMTQKPVGACAITDDAGKLLGIIVEGDIRRTLLDHSEALNLPAQKVMTESPITISENDLAYMALEKMEKGKKQIHVLPVIDEQNQFLGFIRLHDLLKEGFSL